MFITPEIALGLTHLAMAGDGWKYFLFQFLLKPGNPGFNSFNSFGTIITVRQVISQLIVAEYVTNPVAEVIL
jgi:hypothetical protein